MAWLCGNLYRLSPQWLSQACELPVVGDRLVKVPFCLSSPPDVANIREFQVHRRVMVCPIVTS